jgi:hypothetical protein
MYYKIIPKKLRLFCFSTFYFLIFCQSYVCLYLITIYNDDHTEFRFPANCGVPQDTTLGPWLSLIFINELASVLNYQIFVSSLPVLM